MGKIDLLLKLLLVIFLQLLNGHVTSSPVIVLSAILSGTKPIDFAVEISVSDFSLKI